MDDLISRQAAIDDFYKYPNVKWTTLDVLEHINALPSAERRGRWEHLGGDEWCCTACAHVITTEGSWERPWQKYCEECGAKMDLEENDG